MQHLCCKSQCLPHPVPTRNAACAVKRRYSFNKNKNRIYFLKVILSFEFFFNYHYYYVNISRDSRPLARDSWYSQFTEVQHYSNTCKGLKAHEGHAVEPKRVFTLLTLQTYIIAFFEQLLDLSQRVETPTSVIEDGGRQLFISQTF